MGDTANGSWTSRELGIHVAKEKFRMSTQEITKERLERWRYRLAEVDATPMLLLAVGHNQNSGKLVLCTLDEPEFDNEGLCTFLRYALKELGGLP